MNSRDYGQMSMLELFRLEAESQTQILIAGLLTLERQPDNPAQLEACMRAAHSLKGAARIVGLSAAVELAHVLEDCFVAAQNARLVLQRSHIDVLLRGVDLLTAIAKTPETEIERWSAIDIPDVVVLTSALNALLIDAGATSSVTPVAIALTSRTATASPMAAPAATATAQAAAVESDSAGRFLRVTAQNLNRMLGLAGETLVESRRLRPFGDSLLRLKRLQQDAAKSLDSLRELLSNQAIDEHASSMLADARQRVSDCHTYLADRLQDVDMFDRRIAGIADRLYREALACRMRPFADGVGSFPRMLRDLAHQLGKQARLEIVGAGTPVDRDVLEKLEAPLTHLLRNAVDHGIAAPAERLAAGKPAEGLVRLEASHSAGMLSVIVTDDGNGVAFDRVRQNIIDRGMLDEDTALLLSESELLEFLFLPGFTVKDEVTEISGRGVGLDSVQNLAKQLRGNVRAFSIAGQGTRFQLHLPLTFSVINALLVEVGGEPYAFPLAHVLRVVTVSRDDIEQLEGVQHFHCDGQQIGLVPAQQVFDSGTPYAGGDRLNVVLIGEEAQPYGLVVDRLRGARELVVHPLDPRLGKIKDISAGALLEDGAPVLIVDMDDVERSVQKLIKVGKLSQIAYDGAQGGRHARRKRVLVIDDSLTVRELERKLLDASGYEVEVAVDGVDGWNAVRGGRFHLVVTDIDMPRMDGIELVKLIRRDPQLKSLPVMVVSYKDREEDRQRGMEAGADFYLAKGSFHDESLLQAVTDLIGEALA